MKLKKSILFWTAVFCASFFAAVGILALNGLKFRVWFREPATIIIAFGAAVGLLQLILHISQKVWKIAAIVLWLAACIGFGIFGYVQYAFTHRYEKSATIEYNGKTCLVEVEPVMWVDYTRYYEYHGWLVCGRGFLYSDDPFDAVKTES